MSSVSSLWNDLYFSLSRSHTCSISLLLEEIYSAFWSKLCVWCEHISKDLMFTTFPVCLLSYLTMCSSPSIPHSFIDSISHPSFPSPGVIKTALPNMDREVKEQYQVLIQAKDMGGQLGGLAGTTTVNITLSDVNDNPPRFSKSECTLITHFLICLIYKCTHFC